MTIKNCMSMALTVLVTVLLTSISANAASSQDAPVTPATEIHGAPGNTPGFGGNSANPDGAGEGVNGGGGIHNISGGAPGQAGTQGDGNPSGTLHGGLDTYRDSVGN